MSLTLCPRISGPQRSRRLAAASSLTFVPMPSALAERTGSRYLSPMRKRPLNGPASLSTSGRRAWARIPGRLAANLLRAAISTPAAAYAFCSVIVHKGRATRRHGIEAGAAESRVPSDAPQFSDTPILRHTGASGSNHTATGQCPAWLTGLAGFDLRRSARRETS